MPRASARRRQGYAHEVEIEGGHSLVIDEPEDAGGKNEGPSPTRLTAAALASCTAITMEMYADRKGWDVADLEVVVDMEYDGATPSSFTVTLKLPKELSGEQQEGLKVIASKCPVHRILRHETDVSIEDRVELV
jgi:putative redox protein